MGCTLVQGGCHESLMRVYNSPIFIPRGIDPSTGGMGVGNENWKGVYPSNMHRDGDISLDGGYRGTR